MKSEEDSIIVVKRHFVRFYSPGTFIAEQTEKPIFSWDVEMARAMAAEITERYNSHPYAFQFITMGRGENDLNSREIARSNLYYLKGKVRTLAQVIADNLPDEKILRANMEGNGWERIVETRTPWRWTQPLEKGDVVLEDIS